MKYFKKHIPGIENASLTVKLFFLFDQSVIVYELYNVTVTNISVKLTVVKMKRKRTRKKKEKKKMLLILARN